MLFLSALSLHGFATFSAIRENRFPQPQIGASSDCHIAIRTGYAERVLLSDTVGHASDFSSLLVGNQKPSPAQGGTCATIHRVWNREPQSLVFANAD